MNGDWERGEVSPATRRTRLLEVLQDAGSARVSDLAATFGVTPVTVRRDIAHLVDQGLARRVHGGATLAEAAPGTPSEAERAPLRRSNTARTLGLLVPSLDHYWPEVVRSAEEAARAHGLRVILRGASFGGFDERPLLQRFVEVGNVNALLVAPDPTGPHADEVVEWLLDAPVPVVLVERDLVGVSGSLDSAASHHGFGAALAVRHLVELGHRRVGIVLDEQSLARAELHGGWSEACRAAGLPTEGVVDLTVTRRESGGFDAAVTAAVDEIVRTRTTALLVHRDREAMALVQRCEDRGLSVPGDLSVVAYDDEVAGLFTPPLTAVRPPRRAVGRAAVGLVAGRLAEPDRPAHRVVIEPALVVRDSTGAPAAGA
ncbi:substrate-binding domain-containing protein [Streptomyces sp. NBRC 109706]|uniref:substrate-binding domain-containing protein n=1 Tax=Streptomyces sp. NBRC 109706 TaxID=1550035 RepID=UPI000783D58F|nr:substrate-binding domain-containing protein [Streptomyces sp. NBRC 109706]